jgi:FkbM family methyltransferase
LFGTPKWKLKMNTSHKIRTAIRVLAREGPIAFLRTLKEYIVTKYEPYRPDESEIAFEALGADRFKGLMIDVGAHHGRALSPFAHSGWQVFAFEPDSMNREKLVESFADSRNVFIDARAVSDHRQEKAVLFRSKESTGISGLSSFRPSHQIAEEVEVTTLEIFLDERGITDEKVTFLKIDAEGFDLHVLRGFPWHRSSPHLILCEFEDFKTIPLGYSFHDLADFLVGHGYKLIVSEWYPIKRYGGPHDWRRFATYPCQLEDSKAWGNIFATTDDGIYKALLHICRLSY